MAALTEFPAALFFSMAALNGLESTPSLSSAYSAPTEMHWLSRLRRARMYMGTGTLFCVTLPALMRYGMGVRMCAPSMPLPAEPSTRLSRVVPQEACLSTSTSGMPYLAKRPFSFATNRGGRIGERDEAELGSLHLRRGALREGASRQGQPRGGRQRQGGSSALEGAP